MRGAGCALWKFGEKEDSHLGAAVMCEILREGQGQKILRGFATYYEWNPPLMFSWHCSKDLNCLSVIFGCGLVFPWKIRLYRDRLWEVA